MFKQITLFITLFLFSLVISLSPVDGKTLKIDNLQDVQNYNNLSEKQKDIITKSTLIKYSQNNVEKIKNLIENKVWLLFENNNETLEYSDYPIFFDYKNYQSTLNKSSIGNWYYKLLGFENYSGKLIIKVYSKDQNKDLILFPIIANNNLYLLDKQYFNNDDKNISCLYTIKN